MDDRFSTLRAAIEDFLTQPSNSTGTELAAFRNAASVLTIDELLRAHDGALTSLARLTAEGPLGALSPEEVDLISTYRTLGQTGRRVVMVTAESAAKYSRKSAEQSAEVVELRPRK